MSKFFWLLILLVFLTRPMAAWNGEGHMVVAQIAYNHLQPAVKAKCDSLIAVNLGSFSSSATSNFVTAASWADDFKSPLGTAIWHYIDLPFRLDGTPATNVIAADFDVVRAINLCVTNLQNPNLTQSNLAVNLRYLIHFVGDIQQPLHCSTAIFSVFTNGDAGGNLFSINGNWSNLHSLWDAGGGFLTDSLFRPLSVSSQNTLNAKVAVVESAYPYDYTTNLETVPDPMLWAQAGLNRAQTICYVGIATNTTPSTGYLNTASALSEQLMAQGGHRLADLLNTIFATNAVTLRSVSLTSSNINFSWNGLLGRHYRMQFKQDLNDATWTDLTNITASANQTILFSDDLNQARRFYRIAQ